MLPPVTICAPFSKAITKSSSLFTPPPKSIIREVSEEVLNLDYGLDIEETKKTSEMNFTSKADIEKEISKLLKEIKKCSEELDFETAILKRDKMNKLKEMLLEL